MEIGAYRNNTINNILAVSANKNTPISEVGVCKTCANRTYH